ncbi:hypothetical protein [Lacunimicrobium album]
MTPPQSLEEIKKLLLTFPGITFAKLRRDSDPQRVWIDILINDIKELRSLGYWTCYANAELSVGNYEFCDDPNRHDPENNQLPCMIILYDDVQETPTPAEIFGIYIASELEDRGLISTDERRRLGKIWKCVRPGDQR